MLSPKQITNENEYNNMVEEITGHLLKCLNQIRILHWQTTGDARHRALGELYEALDGQIDTFVETLIGKTQRPKFTSGLTLQIQDLSMVGIDEYLIQLGDYLISLTDLLDPRKDSDLLNMRDTMLGEVNHTRYLLTLKF